MRTRQFTRGTMLKIADILGVPELDTTLVSLLIIERLPIVIQRLLGYRTYLHLSITKCVFRSLNHV